MHSIFLTDNKFKPLISQVKRHFPPNTPKIVDICDDTLYSIIANVDNLYVDDVLFTNSEFIGILLFACNKNINIFSIDQNVKIDEYKYEKS